MSARQLTEPLTQTQAKIRATLDRIADAIDGEVRSDRLSRALYATDASIYEIVPDGVVLPKNATDVQTAVRICAEQNTPITARGAGTGLAGGAVNRGVQLDCSRFLNRIVAIDPVSRTATVEPGVVLDVLNAQLAPHGLHFAPDVATSSRATIGGMIANNSCGAHSIVYGRTVDHVASADVVLSDGSRAMWDRTDLVSVDNESDLQKRCRGVLRDVATDCADEIKRRFPRLLRSNGGYGLDRLIAPGDSIDPCGILCGSEGTLGIVTGATLRLTPLPAYRGLIVVHFERLLESLSAVAKILEHDPAAVELVDSFILDATTANEALMRRRGFVKGTPEAVLVVEMFDDQENRLIRRLRDLAGELESSRTGYAWPILLDPQRQADVWEIRKAGLGLLMSRPGDRQAYAFVEDTAVSPARLREYIEKFYDRLRSEGINQVGCYAHASVGCLHVRPVLNLKDVDDVARMRRIADQISSLALEFEGTMTGEHGDGILRSQWLAKMYGPKIIDAFARIKNTFDPQCILNPGKIVDPLPMDENLRYGGGFKSAQPLTVLDFDRHGGMAGLAGMCTGVGQCRQTLVGTMCPSFMATGDETHTTRARANALRIALSDRSLIEGLNDPALHEVMDLCLMCKACKTECPTGTDMTRLKAEWLSWCNRHRGASRRSRMIARSIDWAPWGSRLAPVSNWIMQSRPVRAWMDWRYGLDRRIPPPRFARKTFRQWFKDHRKSRKAGNHHNGRKVAYFVDTWTNFYTPQVGIAAVQVLEALGFRVLVPQTHCCGRPLISKGLLAEAKLLAEQNVEVLAHFADMRIPIVGSEPSCILTFADEFPQLIRTDDARRIAGCVETVESLVARCLRENPEALKFAKPAGSLLYHGHCHQKAMIGTQDAMQVLNACSNGCATQINSGCCGMAGSFGHESEHYDIARAVGEQRLFPAVRNKGDAQIAVSGFSCRHQIHHHTGTRTRHVLEILAETCRG